MTRFIDHTDELIVEMIPRHQSIRVSLQPLFIPVVAGQELLQRARLDPRRQRHRLDALAGQLAELPTHIRRQLPPRFRPSKAIVKLIQIHSQLRTQ